MERNRYIDTIKAVGIFLVILGHHQTIFTQYIYSFHMPLFFFLSGIFHKNYSSYKVFLEKKIKSLIIPYFFFAITLFLYWAIIARNFGEIKTKNISILESLKGIFMGMDMTGVSSMEWGIILWFLLTLFIITNIYYFISKFNNTLFIILVNIFLGIIGFYYNYYKPSYFDIWHFTVALNAIQFYSIGAILKNKILNLSKISYGYIVLLFVINYVGCYYNGKIDMQSLNYGNNMLLFYITAFSGIGFIICLIRNLEIYTKFLDFIGKNTLIILSYHEKCMVFIKMAFIIMGSTLIYDNTIYNIFFSIIQLVLCVPIIMVLNKYFPKFVGKYNKK